jgi:hypothetical protein
MPKRSGSKLQDYFDKLATGTSAILSKLSNGLAYLAEILAVSAGQLVEIMAAFTGQIILSESVITNLVASTAYDVIYDVIRKQLVGILEEEDIRQRAQKASEHLAQAAKILSDLQVEVSERNQELENLLIEIETRRADAEHWAQIASVNEQVASALTKEIERRVRDQFRTELDRGKTRRRVFGVIMWFITLVLGGIVGAAIQQWWQTGRLFR